MQISPSPRPFPQPLDRLALSLLLALSVAIGLLLISGEHAAAKVTQFSWQDKQISAQDRAFGLNFSRPMDQATVAANLKITPVLPGKISWAGRRLAYTLESPAPYGTTFQVRLKDAKAQFSQAPIQPFEANFRTRDRAMAYIGAEGDETGRLVLYNLTQREQKILTPSNLMVMDFQVYPLGDRILFSALERTNQPLGIAEQKLYSVGTGIMVRPPDGSEPSPIPSGQIDLVLDNKEYQNLKFDLSNDGQIIVVQRVNRQNTNEFGPWMIAPGQPPKALKTKEPGGDFVITPDSSALAVAQGQGMALVKLQPQADALEFLPKFGMVLGFASDGSAAAMVKFNTDFTRSLFLVTNQGAPQELLKIQGSIRVARFDPGNQVLYCLLSELIPGETYQEQPLLVAIDLKTALAGQPAAALHLLLKLPQQREIQVSLAPDGLALLFDRTANDPKSGTVGNTAASRLWLLPLGGDLNRPSDAQELPLSGFHPYWLP
jgi:hypothetical protein